MLIAAYTKPADGDIESLSYRHQLDVWGGGPWVSVVFGFVCLVVSSVLIWDPHFLVITVVAGIITLIPRPFGRYVMIPLGSVALVFVLLRIFLPPEMFVGGGTIASFVVQNAVSVPKSIAVAGLLSIGLGVLNMMPLVPLDGGKTMVTMLGQRSEELADRFSKFSLMALLFLFVYTFLFGIN